MGRRMMAEECFAGDRDYVPQQNEAYMCDKHIVYFAERLNSRKAELVIELADIMKTLLEVDDVESDLTDQADARMERTALHVKREHTENEINAIEGALNRMKHGEYGFCQDNGEEIGLERLFIDPAVRLSVAAQERREKYFRMFA